MPGFVKSRMRIIKKEGARLTVADFTCCHKAAPVGQERRLFLLAGATYAAWRRSGMKKLMGAARMRARTAA